MLRLARSVQPASSASPTTWPGTWCTLATAHSARSIALRFIKHRYLIPAGAVERIDGDNESLFVAATKEQVEKAPAYDTHRGPNEECERQTTAYYSNLLAQQTAAE